MELPTCPSCGQSVLDDDAQECPFCGASMSGPKTAKAPVAAKPPAAEKPEPPSPPPEKPEAAAPAKKSRASLYGATVELNPDEMIAADQEALKRAFAVRKDPMKGCRVKIVCPMCEAPGYIPAKAAGQEVKCHNPHCMVPIFTAPAMEKKAAAPEPQPRNMTPWIYGGIVAGVLLLGAGGYYLFFGRARSSSADAPIPFTPLQNGGEQTPKTAKNDGDGGPQKVVDQGPNREEIQQVALNELLRAAQRVPRTRKPFARRWASEAAARIGDVAEAQKQIEQLEAVGRTVLFLKVPPLVEIGWQELKQQRMDDVNHVLANAAQAEQDLRPQGRFQYDAAMTLAALQAAVGRESDAQSTIGAHNSDSQQAQLAADVYLAIQATDFDFSRAAQSQPVGGWTAPQYSGIPAGLIARGRPDEARKWLRALDGNGRRAEATMIWAEFLLQSAPADQRADVAKTIVAETQSLSKAGRVLVLSRAASTAARWEAADVAEPLVAEAQTAVAEIDIPAAVEFDSIKSVVYYSFPDPDPLFLAARAAGELARAQVELGQTDAALESLDRGLRLCRAIAPPPNVMAARIGELRNTSPGVLQSRVQRELRLANIDDARRSLADYQRNCDRLKELADRRFQMQLALLETVVTDQTLDAVAELLKTLKTAAPEEDYAASRVPWLLVERYKLSGNDQRANELHSAIPQETDMAAWQLADVRVRLAAGEERTVIEGINALKAAPALRDRAVFVLLSDMVAAGEWRKAVTIAQGLDDAGLAEEALLLVSAQASTMGNAADINKLVRRSQPKHTEAVSMYTGVLLGTSIPAPAAATEAAPAAAEKQ